jgi:hypothetical protein
MQFAIDMIQTAAIFALSVAVILLNAVVWRMRSKP